MKDDNGVVQVYGTSVHGGNIRQVTQLLNDVQGQFNISPDGQSIALIADNSIWVCDITSGDSKRLTPKSADANAPTSAVVWNHAGTTLVYNRFVGNEEGTWLQIFKLILN